MNFGKSDNIDMNHLNHLTIWIIFGLIIPNKYLVAIILSLLWEVFELSLVRIGPLYEFTKNYWPIDEKFWNETFPNKLIDFFINLFGYFVGSLIRTYYIKC